MTHLTGVDRRPQNVAAIGALLQGASFATLLGVSLWSESHTVGAVARFVLSGIPVWLVLFLVFKQMRRVEAERMETAELQRARDAGGSSTIFEVDQEALLLERNRFHWMVRWLLPATTILVAAYLFVGQFLAWGWSLDSVFEKDGFKTTQRPTLMMWFVAGVGLLSFGCARYTLALGRLKQWTLLHAGAAWMAATSMTCLALAVALMAGTSFSWAEPLLAYIIRVMLLVLAIELTVNLVLDFYRPRSPGEIPRPAFDSRLLGLLSEPGGVAQSIADAVNYQFGFEVSSTWFYQLLQRWLFPIFVATGAVIFLLSSVVLVDADEQGVVEHLGQPFGGDRLAILEPGLHLKWPHPVDIVRRVPVRRLRELVVGEATEKDNQDPNKAIVWTESHDYVPELMLLVAAPQAELVSTPTSHGSTIREFASKSKSGAGIATAPQLGSGPVRASESVPVSLLMVSMPIEYRVKDIQSFLYEHAEPLKLMECVAYQYLSEYAAGVDVDRLIGPGRKEFNEELHRLIQKRLDELKVGVEIAFVGIRGAHPPEKNEVAAAYQGVISSQIKRTALVHAAQGEAQRILTIVAGTETNALRLDEAIRRRDQLSSDDTTSAEPRAAADAQVRELLLGDSAKGVEPVSGTSAAILAGARAKSRDWISTESTKRAAFAAEVTAYQAAPGLFLRRKLLEVYEDLDTVRKFLVVGDATNIVIEYETTEEGGLDRVLSEAANPSKKSGS